jgi:hypothetical protein
MPSEAEHGELRGGDAVEREQLLAERFVARQEQAPRVAARIRLAHQLEKGYHVLVIGDDAVELLEQIEDDIRLPVGNRAAQLRQTVEHADAAYVMAALAQRSGDVELRPPLLDLLFAVTFEALRGHQARVHHDERAQSPHKGRCGVSPWAYRPVSRSSIQRE